MTEHNHTDIELTQEQVAHLGDDLPDLPLISRVGPGVTVTNSYAFVKQHSDWCSLGARRVISLWLRRAHWSTPWPATWKIPNRSCPCNASS